MTINLIIMEKKKTFRRKAKDTLACCFVFNPIERGRAVWKRLDQELPEAIGWWKNDEPRVELFAQKAKELSFLDYYALKEWLVYAYQDMEKSWPENTTGSVEQYLTKWSQIYRQHLEALE